MQELAVSNYFESLTMKCPWTFMTKEEYRHPLWLCAQKNLNGNIDAWCKRCGRKGIVKIAFRVLDE